MEFGAAKPRVTSLLDNEVLSRVERLRINSSGRFTNRSRGEQLHGKGGASNEFADYRDYTAGDDIRYVDWNIFSRLQRPYLKQYRHEEEQHVVILIDASASMNFEGKFERAKQLAAAFAVMGLFATEKVSIYSSDGRQGELSMLPPCTGRPSMRKVFGFVEPLVTGEKAPLEVGIMKMLNRHRGRGVVIVLSDFLTFGDLTRAFTRLFSSGLELFAVQILGPSELNPELTGDMRFVDSETNDVLDVTAAGDLVELYHEYLFRFRTHVEETAKQRAGRYMTVESQSSLKDVLFDQMRRRAWIKG
jgi:uncharacterized protein (DUF58 family)